MEIVTSPKNHFLTLSDSVAYTFWLPSNIIGRRSRASARKASNVKILYASNNQK